MIQQTTLELPPEKRAKILEILNKRKEAGKIGLYYLDKEEMESIFLPVLKEKFGLETKFQRVWGHFTDQGGERPWHKHTNFTMLYYLQIPKGDVGNFVHEDGEIIPKENDLYIFSPMLNHKIKPNKTNQTRWAIASECIKNSTFS